MPFQPINFAGLPVQPSSFDLVNSLVEGYKAGQVPSQMKRQAEQEQLANAFKQMQLQQEPQRFSSEMKGQDLANALNQFKVQEEPEKFKSAQEKERLSNIYQNLVNQGYSTNQASEIALRNAQTKYYGQGGPGQKSADIQKEHNFMNNILSDNPHLQTPEQIREAANAIINGKDKLSDGTPINPMSNVTRMSYDQYVKSTTPAAIITQGIKSEKAQAELPILQKYIDKGRGKYGNTVLGHDISLIWDAARATDPEKLDDIGKAIASNALSFEQAQLQTLIAGAPQGVTLTKHLMKVAKQYIDQNFPVLKAESRKSANEYLSKALEEAYGSRKAVYPGASTALPNQNGTSPKNVPKKVSFEELEKL